jgi:hypothetical protein
MVSGRILSRFWWAFFSSFNLGEAHALSMVSKISYGVTSAKRQRVFSNAI